MKRQRVRGGKLPSARRIQLRLPLRNSANTGWSIGVRGLSAIEFARSCIIHSRVCFISVLFILSKEFLIFNFCQLFFPGEEMDFIQLLKSFGLDMSSVANALGIDMHTLNNMDHDVLLHLLTQQTN
jgi:hypothetical protein